MEWIPPAPAASRCAGLEESQTFTQKEESEMKLARIGLDLAKNVFQIHGVDRTERVVVRRASSRNQLVRYFEKLAPCLIGMEACASAHHRGGYFNGWVTRSA
jgi:hypothetical protein